jgi:hypothetical protein
VDFLRALILEIKSWRLSVSYFLNKTGRRLLHLLLVNASNPRFSHNKVLIDRAVFRRRLWWRKDHLRRKPLTRLSVQNLRGNDFNHGLIIFILNSLHVSIIHKIWIEFNLLLLMINGLIQFSWRQILCRRWPLLLWLDTLIVLDKPLLHILNWRPLNKLLVTKILLRLRLNNLELLLWPPEVLNVLRGTSRCHLKAFYLGLRKLKISLL